MRAITTTTVTFAACLALLATTACGSSAGGAGTDGREASMPTARRASAAGLAPALRALRTAERGVRRGKAYDIERDRFRGRRVWEVKVARGMARPYEIDVRADGREIVRRERESRVSDDVRKAAGARVSLARALRIAARRAGGARFDEAEIDRWRGRLVWEATFERPGNREVEVKVDARAGRVLAVTVDD